MSWQKDNIKYALGFSTIFSFYGIVAIATLYAGSVMGYNDWTWRIVIIAVILITLPFSLVIGYFTQKKLMGSGEEGEAKPEDQADAKTDKQKEEEKKAKGAATASGDISANAQEAVQWLRTTKLGGGDAVYALPWYVTAGPQRSGKTSLVLSSSLDFQTLPSQRQTEQQIVRPTNNAEWRVTASAVFVDTAGRYQNEGEEGEEWAGLLEAIKKVRGSRPIDGLLIPVSTERVLRMSENDIEQQAKNLRARIDETMQRTKLRFPVYLIFTHADAVEGFKDYFSISQKENKRYVWGATIPLEKSANAHALFDVEYDLLYSALMKRRLFRLANPFPPVRLLRIFNFPQRFADSRRKLGLFTSVLFRPNPFSESPLLRGFYFTANVQSSGHPRTAGVQDLESDAPKAVGQGWFTEKFFRDVLLRDKDMVASFQSQVSRPPIFSAFFLLITMMLGFLWLGGTALSYIQNRKLLDEAKTVGTRVSANTKSDADKDPLKKDNNAVGVELRDLDELRRKLVELDYAVQKRPPIYMRFGLYSGSGEVNNVLRTQYFEALKRRFTMPAFDAVKKDLKAFTAGNPPPIPPTEVAEPGKPPTQDDILGHYYDLLKAYMILTGEEKVRDKAEATFLTKKLEPYWNKSAPGNEALALAQLKFFAENVSRDDAAVPRVTGGKESEYTELTANSCKKLQAFPVYRRYYKNILTEVSAKTTKVTMDLMTKGKAGGAMASTHEVPGAYTIEGYRAFMKAAIEQAGPAMSKEDWVCNTGGGGNAQDIENLSKLYFGDYTNQWREMVRKTSVIEYPKNNKEEAVRLLGIFSADDSPMELFVKELQRQTQFSAKPTPGAGIWEWIKSFLPSSDTPPLSGETKVEDEFRNFYNFAGDGKDNKGQVSEYRGFIGQVKNALDFPNVSLTQVQADVVAGKKDKVFLSESEQKIKGQLDPFKGAAEAEIAALLKQPLGNFRDMLMGGGFNQIQDQWVNVIRPLAQNLEKGGSPFEGQGKLPLGTLNDFLNPVNGKFTEFFNQRLANYFEEAGEGKWKLKEGPFKDKFSPDFVTYLNNVRKLREALYPNNSQTPQVKYNLTLNPVAEGTVIIVIDGVTAQVPLGGTADSKGFTWPASSGTSQGAKISVQTTDGAPKDLPFPEVWGVFDMFRQGGAKKVGETNKYDLTWTVGGTGGIVVTATITPDNKNNPFDKALFDFRAPQNIQK